MTKIILALYFIDGCTNEATVWAPKKNINILQGIFGTREAQNENKVRNMLKASNMRRKYPHY
jgi:hypothetical protein